MTASFAYRRTSSRSRTSPQSWENPDPQTWIFKLRDGVTFHDGTPLTADDVVFTYQTILKPEMNAPLRGLFTPISKVEAIDAKTVKFTLSTSYSPLLSYLEMGIVPKKAVEGGADLALKPIGTGPMKLVRWDRGSRIVLAAEPAILGRRSEAQGIAARRHRRQHGKGAGLRGQGSRPHPVAALAPGHQAAARQ